MLLLTASPCLAAPAACDGSTVDNLGADYARGARAFLVELQAAFRSGDKAKVAALAAYPLRVNGARTTFIRSKAQLLARYDAVFKPSVRKAVLDQTPRCLFGRDQGAMVGGGELWFQTQANGRFAVITVNEP